MHIPQINVMMLFSSTRAMSTFVRILPRSIRDVSAMANAIDMASLGLLLQAKDFSLKII